MWIVGEYVPPVSQRITAHAFDTCSAGKCAATSGCHPPHPPVVGEATGGAAGGFCGSVVVVGGCVVVVVVVLVVVVLVVVVVGRSSSDGSGTTGSADALTASSGSSEAVPDIATLITNTRATQSASIANTARRWGCIGNCLSPIANGLRRDYSLPPSPGDDLSYMIAYMMTETLFVCPSKTASHMPSLMAKLAEAGYVDESSEVHVAIVRNADEVRMCIADFAVNHQHVGTVVLLGKAGETLGAMQPTEEGQVAIAVGDGWIPGRPLPMHFIGAPSAASRAWDDPVAVTMLYYAFNEQVETPMMMYPDEAWN